MVEGRLSTSLSACILAGASASSDLRQREPDSPLERLEWAGKHMRLKCQLVKRVGDEDFPSASHHHGRLLTNPPSRLLRLPEKHVWAVEPPLVIALSPLGKTRATQRRAVSAYATKKRIFGLCAPPDSCWKRLHTGYSFQGPADVRIYGLGIVVSAGHDQGAPRIRASSLSITQLVSGF